MRNEWFIYKWNWKIHSSQLVTKFTHLYWQEKFIIILTIQCILTVKWNKKKTLLQIKIKLIWTI
jgi:hypothetical protein